MSISHACVATSVIRYKPDLEYLKLNCKEPKGMCSTTFVGKVEVIHDFYFYKASVSNRLLQTVSIFSQ